MNDLEKLLDGLDPAMKEYLNDYVDKTQVITKQKLIALSHELSEEFEKVKSDLKGEHKVIHKDVDAEDDDDYTKILLAEVWTSIVSVATEINNQFNTFMEEKLVEMLEEAMGKKGLSPVDDEMEELRQLLRQTEADLVESDEDETMKLLKNLPKPPKGEMN